MPHQLLRSALGGAFTSKFCGKRVAQGMEIELAAHRVYADKPSTLNIAAYGVAYVLHEWKDRRIVVCVIWSGIYQFSRKADM
nr:hypothetical protein [Cerasicoccus arenae]